MIRLAGFRIQDSRRMGDVLLSAILIDAAATDNPVKMSFQLEL